ncbi:serine hydrolase domain-containing protein [Nonomuraea sp. NPDC049152]|uniref:serine hydrolase domain-containing protein n=1 Tax=Nonomuraea sp. NPDC049152 TaxID=3154350 RepID=UPI0033D2ACC0
MSQETLSDFVEATATKFGIPGVCAGVWADGREIYAGHGVTSIDNPLPVDEQTLFLLGSVTKPFTATALMRLVAEGRVELEAPVHRYVPEAPVSAEITVAHLLNHTAGLDWGVITDTGEGDDAVARYVAKMAELEMIAPVGARVSYSQAGYNLIGRVIEKVTGQPYDQAVASLVLEPAGLSNTFSSRDDVMTRRFAVGHDKGEDGTLSISRPWRHWGGDHPGGGIASSASDLLSWARFHLGDGTGVLPAEVLHRMRQPTAELRASNLGDAIGLGWFLREVDGVRTAGHGGSSNGQFAELLLVPERNFAVVVMSNANPDGIPCNQAVVRWALQHYLGVTDADPEPAPYDDTRAREIVGRYENEVMTLAVTADGAGLTLEVLIKPEIRENSEVELPADHAPFPFGLLPGDTDEYVITDGAFTGQRGFFSRDDTGAITGVDLAGRPFTRTV